MWRAIKPVILAVGVGIVLVGCAEDQQVALEKQFTIEAKNNLDAQCKDAVVQIDVAMFKQKAADFNPAAAALFVDGVEIPSQAVDSDGDDTADQIVAVMDFAAGETKTVVVKINPEGTSPANYKKRTQAELSKKINGEWGLVENNGNHSSVYQGGEFQNITSIRVPDEHTDHSFFFRYEGPGWESDKVGYRFYLDWRNAIDIFGKKTPEMVLQNVGLDGFDSYHEMADWGADILKVGESLGMASLGMWRDGKVYRVSSTDSIYCSIPENGPVYSSIKTEYYGWQVNDERCDVVSTLSILAGQRLTKHDIQVNPVVNDLCTGLVKHESAELITSSGDGEWQYLATFGEQTMEEDGLGMAVLYKKSDLVSLTEDALNHVVVLQPNADGELSYSFLAAWEQEPNGITSREAFIAYLDQTVSELAQPISIASADSK